MVSVPVVLLPAGGEGDTGVHISCQCGAASRRLAAATNEPELLLPLLVALGCRSTKTAIVQNPKATVCSCRVTIPCVQGSGLHKQEQAPAVFDMVS